METQNQTQLYHFRKVVILLAFLVGLGSCVHDSSSSRAVTGSESNFGSNKYILQPYFEKHESFVESTYQDFISAELSSYSSKLLPNDLHDLLQLSVPNRLLIGEGSHRHLYSNIRIQSLTESISQLPYHYCKAIIIERLPLGVFADPFELHHLLQHGVFTAIAVFGDANLEVPSVASNRTIVEIHLNVNSSSFSGKERELYISINLPLHARYSPLDESGYAKIEFSGPDLFMKCSQEGNSNNQSYLFTPSVDPVALKTDAVEWRIPAGKRSHAEMVSIVTFIAAFVSTLVIVTTSFFYSKSSL